MTQVFSRSRVTTVSTIRRIRLMPASALPRVTPSQVVKPLDVVAFNELPGQLKLIKLAEILKTDAKKVEAYLRFREGDQVSKGAVLAERRISLGLRRLRVVAPIDGVIARINRGELLLEGERHRDEILASIPGRVTAVESGHHVTIETTAALIEIAWGYGNLAWGTLKVMDNTPGIPADPGRFNIDHRGAIVAIGSQLTEAFLKAAMDIRVKGLIAPSMNASLVPEVEKVDFPLGLTQGFGSSVMNERIFNLLFTYNGREIAMDMKVSPDWRDTRPEIIIPVTGQNAPEERPPELVFKTGQKARILQMPHFGEIGTISAIPAEAQQLDSGLWSTGAVVQVHSGAAVFVPFANLEHLG